MRALHLEPLATWITQHWHRPGRVPRLLDFGCGDLLLADLLGMECVVDGFDINPAAVLAARRARRPKVGTVMERRSDIPFGAYDGVVLSSMVQYLDGPEALGELLAAVASWLAPDRPLGVVMTDVVTPGGSRGRDAFDLAVDLTRHLGVAGAARQVVRTARRSPGRLLRLDDAEVAGAAEGAGLVARRLPMNLSPFTRRASYELRLV